MTTQSMEQISDTGLSSGIREKTNRKGIIAFLLIAFGIAWLPVEIPIRLGVPYGPHLLKIVWPFVAFAPAVACFVVRKWVTREGFADAGLRLNLRTWPYYLVGWFLPLVVIGSLALLAPLFGVGRPDFSFARGINDLVRLGFPAIILRHPILLIGSLIIAAIFAMPLQFGEEFGWRGYLQLRLFPEQPVLSAVITGLIWAVWHYPLTFRGYDFPDHPVMGSLLIFPVAAIFLSIIFGWLRLKTGSVWSSCLAHSATNAIAGMCLILLFGDGRNSLVMSYGGLLAWIPLGALSAWIVFTGQLKPANKSNLQTKFVPETATKLRLVVQ